ncbi:MAG: DNA gyrase inhibitor YacG [Thermoguttaceae bacterium]
MARCPICQREFRPEDSQAMPFCSKRCRLIDLGRWLGEKYAVPEEPGEAEEPDEPPPDENEDS